MNKQLTINMLSQMITFAVQLFISFFLTPYIVKNLGVEAYGYIGLSNNMISYTTLLTVALNSMAGRFITVEYHKGNIGKAKKYFSSVMISNVVLSALLFCISLFFVVYLENIIEITPALVFDVKFLFALLCLNSILGLVTNVFQIATFVKNRLELSSLRQIIGNIIRVVVIVTAFAFFTPHVWYVGAAAVVCSLYVAFVNYRYTLLLTPELNVRLKDYDFTAIKELLFSGIWNTFSRLSEILSKGLDLLLANVFIGATAMGLLSVAYTIPVVIVSVCSTLSACFAPEITQLYAKNESEKLTSMLLKSVRIMGFFASIPLAILFSYGDLFYKLWIPSESSLLLYQITIASSFGMIFGMPQESLWNIFTVTNTVKKSSLNLLFNSFLIILIVLFGMVIAKTDMQRLFVLATTRSVVGSLRCLTFLPMQGAKCLNLNKLTFYGPVLKNVMCVSMIVLFSLLLKCCITDITWLNLLLCCFATMMIGVVTNVCISLTKSDRVYLWNILKGKIGRK